MGAALASEVEAALQAPDYPDLFRHMYGNTPDAGTIRSRDTTGCASSSTR